MFTTVLLYETRARFYVVQGTEDKSSWRILKVSREETHDRKLEMSEDVTVYTEAQCSRRGERPLTPRWQSLHSSVFHPPPPPPLPSPPLSLTVYRTTPRVYTSVVASLKSSGE